MACKVQRMAAITQRGSRWQIRVRHALLPKPYFDTFSTEAEARAYAAQLEGLLDRGIVPSEMASAEKRGADPTLARLLEAYQNAAPIAPSDQATVALLASTLPTEWPGLRLSGITAAWPLKSWPPCAKRWQGTNGPTASAPTQQTPPWRCCLS